MTILSPTPSPTDNPAPASYEDATVYSSGVVLHPLPGRPEYQGVIQAGPSGPIARIQDGDLVLRPDIAAIDRWLLALGEARAELTGTTGTDTPTQSTAGGTR